MAAPGAVAMYVDGTCGSHYVAADDEAICTRSKAGIRRVTHSSAANFLSQSQCVVFVGHADDADRSRLKFSGFDNRTVLRSQTKTTPPPLVSESERARDEQPHLLCRRDFEDGLSSPVS